MDEISEPTAIPLCEGSISKSTDKCPHCGAELKDRNKTWFLWECGTQKTDIMEERSSRCYKRELANKNEEIEAIRKALNGYKDSDLASLANTLTKRNLQLEADKARVDWLEKRENFFELAGEFIMEAKYYADKGETRTIIDRVKGKDDV